ncbi:uncharacterized protein M421DRAFT_406456, partial [Didymella exigua CBS 183.55]
ILLSNQLDWPYWFAQLELHARDTAIWDQIDPEAETVPPIDEQEPEYPELPPKPLQEGTPSEIDDLDDLGNQTQRMTQEYYDQAVQDHPEAVRKYKVATSKWTRNAAKLSNIRNWINITVSADLMAPALIKLVNSQQLTLQALIRVLKADLALMSSNTQNLVRQQYRAYLEKARSGHISPDKWFNKWHVPYRIAQAFSILDIKGDLALTDFLNAVSYRIAPK